MGTKIILLSVVGAGLGLAGCRHLPAQPGRPASPALAQTADTRLGRALAPAIGMHPGLSGFLPLPSGHDAFAARAVLAKAAERSLDVQYYLWHRDLSGSLLWHELLLAADRGVRVRLLLDDNNSDLEIDRVLAALDAHPRIEVRLFNPFRQRRLHLLGYLTEFMRLNRRMHNKAFIVDNQAAIIGGRNIGDQYFGATESGAFADLDALAVGAVVPDVTRAFEAYWDSGSSYPVTGLIPALDAAAVARETAALAAVADDPAARGYLEAVARQPIVPRLLEGRIDLEWTTVRLVNDDPAKGLGRAPKEHRLAPQLIAALGEPQSELQIVSPYFVPTSAGTKALTALAAKGVRVTVLTNSLAATDVLAVHSGYVQWRRRLLRAGIRIHELKSTSDAAPAQDRSLHGGSSSSLHAKTIAIDRRRIFIGSFNWDPRSNLHNTEMGFVIDSPGMATTLAGIFGEPLLDRAYEVRIDEQNRTVWRERRDGEIIVHRHEPDSTFWQRTGVRLLSWLPIDWLL